MNLINGNVFTGVETGVATATSVSLGFRPSYVKVINETEKTIYETFYGGKTTSIVDSGDGTTDISSATAATTNLIITSTGFTVASSASDVLDYIAVR